MAAAAAAAERLREAAELATTAEQDLSAYIRRIIGEPAAATPTRVGQSVADTSPPEGACLPTVVHAPGFRKTYTGGARPWWR